IASLVELLIGQTQPAAVHLAALYLAAEHEHGVGVTVIGAAGAVLMSGASELRHGDQRDVLGAVAHVAPEGCDAVGEVAEPAGKLAIHATLRVMRIPSIDIGECGL